jgi:hypothetical protein
MSGFGRHVWQSSQVMIALGKSLGMAGNLADAADIRSWQAYQAVAYTQEMLSNNMQVMLKQQIIITVDTSSQRVFNWN